MVVSGTLLVFVFNDTATTEIYTLSLHDALPISSKRSVRRASSRSSSWSSSPSSNTAPSSSRSEEHTSELQSRQYLVCRLLLEKKTQAGPTWGGSLVCRFVSVGICDTRSYEHTFE